MTKKRIKGILYIIVYLLINYFLLLAAKLKIIYRSF